MTNKPRLIHIEVIFTKDLTNKVVIQLPHDLSLEEVPYPLNEILTMEVKNINNN